MSAAATVLILFCSAAFYFLHQKNERQIIAQNANNQPVKDIPAGRNNAVLTLDNGTTILLDTAANGTLAKQGNIKVLKLNGQIAYNKAGDMNAKPVYNTITTGNGNQYQLILTDGSKVWLNAASSIRFPTAFTGNDRKVEISGEAYFEVAKDPKKPFKVDFKNKAGQRDEIEVLGTHFNVNTYADEPDMKTTLLEGSVKIKAADKIQILSPGQQARITSDGIEIKRNVDLDNVMAWKNGYFIFDNTDIYTLMRQVSRWYNVEVIYQGKITEEGFSGKISREVPLSKFIKVLQLNDVQVKTEGRKMIVGSEND
jgi:transmembrane sensor